MKKKKVKVLIVVISATLYQWHAEVSKFTDLSSVVSEGSTKARKKIYENFRTSDDSILIINYTKILHDFDSLSQINFDSVIFDEASSLKDNTSKIYQHYNWLLKKVERIVMLTGTPISNNIGEFYNLFQLFNINYLPPFPEFKEKFLETKRISIVKNNRKFYMDVITGSKNIKEFEKLLYPFYLRRVNSNEGKFKDIKLNINKYPIPMTEEQKTLSKKVLKEFRDDSEDEITPLKVHSDFTKIACSPYIYDNSYSKFSPKVKELIKFILTFKKKVVVFAKFLEFHAIIKEELEKAGISYVSITGEESDSKKEENKLNFNNSSDINVLLMTGAGKFGLNLQKASTFIFLDMPYTPSDVFQYIGRVYRTGQTEDVSVYFFYMSNSLEEDFFFSLERKQAEIDEFFKQNKKGIFKLDSGGTIVKGFLRKNYSKGSTYVEELLTKQEEL